MAKYIDADKLLEELDIKRKDCLIARNEFKTDDPELAAFYEGKAKMCATLYHDINSIKQEQDILVLNKKDWEAQEQFRKDKDFGKPLKQEQPKMDLDELIVDFLLNNYEFLIESDSKAVVQKLAHHFYELGLNARKV